MPHRHSLHRQHPLKRAPRFPHQHVPFPRFDNTAEYYQSRPQEYSTCPECGEKYIKHRCRQSKQAVPHGGDNPSATRANPAEQQRKNEHIKQRIDPATTPTPMQNKTAQNTMRKPEPAVTNETFEEQESLVTAEAPEDQESGTTEEMREQESAVTNEMREQEQDPDATDDMADEEHLVIHGMVSEELDSPVTDDMLSEEQDPFAGHRVIMEEYDSPADDSEDLYVDGAAFPQYPDAFWCDHDHHPTPTPHDHYTQPARRLPMKGAPIPKSNRAVNPNLPMPVNMGPARHARQMTYPRSHAPSIPFEISNIMNQLNAGPCTILYTEYVTPQSVAQSSPFNHNLLKLLLGDY